jgi:hypothetical protein
MIVYVIAYSAFDGGHVNAVFADKTKAEIWRDKLNQTCHLDKHYEEYIIQEMDTEEVNPNENYYVGYISKGDEIDYISEQNSDTRYKSYATPILCVGDERYSIRVWAKDIEEAKLKVIEQYHKIEHKESMSR